MAGCSYGQAISLADTILWELRLPRALAAFATGGLLALAGALMQVLLRNPLADPYILGVSGGAASAALLLMLLGAGSVGDRRRRISPGRCCPCCWCSDWRTAAAPGHRRACC